MLDNTYWQIPEHTYGALKRYVEDGIPTGGFLYAVLTNDLSGTFGKADCENIEKIKEICGFVYNEIPSGAWGNIKKVNKWIKQHGMKGVENANN